MIVICLQAIILFPVFLSNKNNFRKIYLPIDGTQKTFYHSESEWTWE